MKLESLIGEISYHLAGNPSFDYLSKEVRVVTARLSHAGEEALFVCVHTALGNGHDSAVAAYNAGCRLFLAQRRLPLPDDAAVLVVEDTAALLGELAARCEGYPARQLTVFGITGTAGKSTVAHMVTELLKGAGHRVALLTTDGYALDNTRHPAGNVVPDAAEIQHFLADAVCKGATFAVLEFSSYMLAQKAAFSIPFAAVLLTNLWPCHIGSGEHAHMAAYREAKESLFSCKTPFYVLPTANADFGLVTDGRRVLFGEKGDFFAEGVEPYADRTSLGVRLDLHVPTGEKVAVSLPVPGDHSVQNALAAAALATIAGLSPAEIAAGLSAYVPRGRLECIGVSRERYIFVDAAYTAEDLTRALQVLRSQTRGKLTVVIGSVGGRARWRRAPLGAAATTYADLAYFTADDPDCEDPCDICADMVAGVNDPDRYVILPDRERAIRRAVSEMRPGDILLLAGKGMQETQLIRSKRIPFSEREIVKEVLLSM